MKIKSCVSVFAVLIFASLFLAGCERSPKSDESKTKWVDPAKLEPGPIQHTTLTDAQMERVKFLQKTFNDVDPIPLDKWVEDFKRDANPDQELNIWESMAAAYSGFTATTNLSLEAKKEAYQVVLLRSAAPNDEVLKRVNVKILTGEDVRKILALYTDKPEPIQVIKQ